MNRKIVEKLNKYLSEDADARLIKYVIVDHIPSNQPFIFPIKEVIDLCRSSRPDIISIIDAAHSFGSIANLDLDQLKPDILFGNCHKWLAGPKGTAILYKRDDLTAGFKISSSITWYR